MDEDEFWDIVYDVWIYADGAIQARRAGNVSDGKRFLDLIQRRLTPVPAGSPSPLATSDTGTTPASG